MEEINEFADIESPKSNENLLFDFDDIPEAAPEVLPHRGTPYFGEEAKSALRDIYETVNANPYSPQISEADLEARAEMETEFFIFKLRGLSSLSKGVISTIILSETEQNILRQYKAANLEKTAEIVKLEEREQIKLRLENPNQTQTADEYLAKRKMIKTAIKLDLQKKLSKGKWEELSLEQMMLRMASTEVMAITGNNPEIFSILSQRLVGKLF